MSRYGTVESKAEAALDDLEKLEGLDRWDLADLGLVRDYIAELRDEKAKLEENLNELRAKIDKANTRAAEVDGHNPGWRDEILNLYGELT